MPYKIKTDCYKNGVFFGSPTLYPPKFNGVSTSGGIWNGYWSDIVSQCGDNGFTCFKISYSAPSGYGSVAPMDVNYWGIRSHILETVRSGESVIYDFVLKGASDNKVRTIRIVQTGSQSYDTPTIHLRNPVTISYILNGATKLTLTSSIMEYDNNSSGITLYHRERGFYIPWKGLFNGTETFFWHGECFSTYETTTLDPTPGSSMNSVSYSHSETSNYLDAFNEWLAGYEPDDYDEEDPYPDPDDPDDDDTDDPDPDPLPTISAVGTGFATIFTPSLSQLRNLSSRFWNATIIDFFQNLVENIENMFLSLAMVPFSVPAGRTVSVNFLGLFDTGISLTLAAQQFIEFNMGSIDLGNNNKIWKSNSALDYSPFSKLSIYLPFIGSRELDIDDCRGKVINLKYRIDILSGECVALISVGGGTIYQFSGNCLTQIPITHENMRGLVSDAIMVATTFATGATSTGAAIAEEGAAVAGAQTAGELASEGWKLGNKITRNASALASTTANAVLGGKPSYTKSGSISGACGFLAVRQPYLYLTTPISAIPNYYRKYSGYPCNRTVKLSQLSGFTVVESIRLNNLVATAPEVAEIYDLLKEGVII